MMMDPMSVPHHIVVVSHDTASSFGDVESMISFDSNSEECYHDDELSTSTNSDEADDGLSVSPSNILATRIMEFEFDFDLERLERESRWEEGDEHMPSHNSSSNLSPRVPQRRESILLTTTTLAATMAACEIPRIPRRRRTIKLYSSSQSIATATATATAASTTRSSSAAADDAVVTVAPRTMSMVTATRPRTSSPMLPRQGILPPKFPSRKRSVEAAPVQPSTRLQDICGQQMLLTTAPKSSSSSLPTSLDRPVRYVARRLSAQAA